MYFNIKYRTIKLYKIITKDLKPVHKNTFRKYCIF